jgi:hypothetical protein
VVRTLRAAGADRRRQAVDLWLTAIIIPGGTRLPSADQDDIALAIMRLAGSDPTAPVVLSPDEREAIARSKAAAQRGEFATDEQVRAVWAKHGL